MSSTAQRVTKPRRRKKAARKGFPLPPKDPVQAAQVAGLRYVQDGMAGLRRERSGRGFRYLHPDGTPVRHPDELRRIRALAIPPAWTDVWICPSASGHLQTTGRDAKGRKQHRYHPRWREVRDETKYGRLVAFGQALPQIRARVEHDLALPGLPQTKVLATVVRLLEATLIRVGNEEYVKQNGSFGLTTMRNGHANVSGGTLRFSFRGKSGVRHAIEIQDHRLARIVRQCQELPGQELFGYIDEDGQTRTVDSADVNEYLRQIAGEDFTAKDFRTWAGTVLAAWALKEFEAFDSEAQAKRNVVQAIEAVAKRLGNTKEVCRKCYIHPVVLDSYLDGTLVKTLSRKAEQELTQSLSNLPPEEAAVLMLLQQQLRRQADQ